MKLLDENKSEEKTFKPFELNIKVESMGEAKLLFHVFDHPELKNALFEKTNNPECFKRELNKDVPENFYYKDRDEIVRKILSHINI